MSRDSQCFFQALFSLMKPFFKLTRTACHGLPDFLPLLCGWCGLYVVKGVDWLCMQSVKCNTESYSVLCFTARKVFPALSVILLAALHLVVNESSHSSHHWNQQVLVVGSLKLVFHDNPPIFYVFGCDVLCRIWLASTDEHALQSLPEQFSATSASRGCKILSLLIPIQQSHSYSQFTSHQNGMLSYIVDTSRTTYLLL